MIAAGDVFGLQREAFNMHIKQVCSYIITIIKTKKTKIILFTLLAPLTILRLSDRSAPFVSRTVEHTQ